MVAQPGVTIATDGKVGYAALVKDAIPDAIHEPHVRVKKKKKTDRTPVAVPTGDGLPHDSTATQENKPQKPWAPLYRLNQTAAKLRADISRLARRTWSASKRASRLGDHLAIYVAFNNGYAIS